MGECYSKSLKDLSKGSEVVHIIGMNTDLKEANGQEIFMHDKEAKFYNSYEDYLRDLNA